MKNYKYIKGTLLLILILLFINSCNKHDRKINNIKAFAKLYGYVRWFHPSDEAQQIDWDKFAIYGVKKVENAANEHALKDSLMKLFKPIAPSLKIHLESEKKAFNISEITPSDTSEYKIIAWQHKGVKLDFASSQIYESIRMNRPNPKSVNKMPQVYNMYNVEKFHNRNIRLKLLIKGNENDSIGLFILPIRKYNTTELSKRIKPKYFKCETDWKKKEIKSYIRNEELIVFGVRYNGEDSVLFDNFEIEIKGKNAWKKIDINNLNLNKVYDNKPEEFFCFSNANHNVRSKLIDSTNNNYCLQILKKKDYKLFKYYPKHGELIDEKISEELWIKLPLALLGNTKKTFPEAEKLKELQNNYNKKQTKTFERLGSIIITWNIFQHFYPYFKEVKVDWEKEFETAIQYVDNDKTERDFLNTLRKFTAKIKDGHIYVSHQSDEWSCLPIAWEWIEDELVVTKVFDNESELEVGDIVNRVNNMPAEEYFRDVQQYISASTPGYLNYYSQIKALMGKRNTECVLSVKKNDGNDKKIKLRHSLRISSFYSKFKNQTKYKFHEGSIIYLNLEAINMAEIDTLMPEILNSKALICDLRGYPSDNILPFLSNLLKVEDTIKWMSIPKIIYPNNNKTLYNDFEGWKLKPKKPYINIPVVFITDNRAISYAESVMGIVKHYKLATIVGQPTAGTNGNINIFNLPRNYSIRFTGMKVTKLDGTQHHGIGVLPDIYVEKTIKGIKKGKDEFLEKAIKVLKK